MLDWGVQFIGALKYLIPSKAGAYLKTINDGLLHEPVTHTPPPLTHTSFISWSREQLVE